ncbi:hypothetical protein FALBO_9386 [Fusarium albosuccineum]|uniref:Uncharacterized protein n=1 Tax=Fusarium albosuccineum TaxID=1237068 RepID=A0A8H4L8Y2_9HYPO|nr:hypothetical protein FALBO_9386 [Fusarium albosuccineum]
MEASASYPRHLAAPYNLQDPNLDILQGAPLSFLEATFPGVNSVTEGRNRSYINFHLRDHLPRRPWPLTIGGIPITLSTRAIGRGTLFPDCHSTRHFPRPVCEDFDGRYTALSDNDLRRIATQLEPLIYSVSHGISITEIVFASVGVVYVILKLDLLNSILVWGRLPSSIAKCPAVYLFDHDIEEALSCANGETQYTIPAPSGTDVIRSGPVSPGAIVHSPNGSSSNQVAHTTSGVLIKDGAGKQFVATSINPKDTQEVCQTLPTGQPRCLGTAVAQVPFTHVTLVKPQSNVKVTNEVQIAGYQGRLTRLLGEQPADDVAWHDRIHIVSPFANNLDGVVEAKSVRPEYDLTQKGSMDKCGIVGHTVHHWAYMGQVEDVGDGVQAPMPTKGALGAAVVRSRCNSVAAGLFRRYYRKGPFAGFGVYLSASELVKAGYQLA